MAYSNSRILFPILLAMLATVVVIGATWPRHDAPINTDMLAIPRIERVADAAEPSPLVPPAQSRWIRMVHRMDRDGDGLIARDEWTQHPAMFDRVDVNGDGLIDSREGELAAERADRRGRVDLPTTQPDMLRLGAAAIGDGNRN